MLTTKQKARRFSVTSADLLRSAKNAGIDTVNASKIWIDDIEYTGYFTYTFAYLKTYTKEPERSISGTIDNLNSYSTFLTPTLTIDFKYMKIETYRKLMKQLHTKNEFLVKCYDVENDSFVTLKMYFKPESAPELYKKGLDFLAVLDYQISLVGTNASLGLFSIIYNSNPPAGTGATAITQSDNQEYVLGEEVIIGQNVAEDGDRIQDLTFNDDYSFRKWNTKSDGSGTSYIDQSVYTINSADLSGETLVLYAMWDSVQEHNYTLSYNYGIGKTYQEQTGTDLVSKKIKLGEAYGTLPDTDVAPITYCGEEYTPYTKKGWYKTPQIVTGSVAVTPETLYTAHGNTTIYQIFEPNEITIAFDVNGGQPSLEPVIMKYGESITLPNYVNRQNYTLKGWQDVSNGGNIIASASMLVPPTNITLVAQWEVNEE